MNTAKIRAKKDLYNGGKCFTKNHEYIATLNRPINMESSLLEAKAVNNMGQTHIIGSWWRNFELIEIEETDD